eukprot:5529926-Alexandrium_andersonii.AAC.1
MAILLENGKHSVVALRELMSKYSSVLRASETWKFGGVEWAFEESSESGNDTQRMIEARVELKTVRDSLAGALPSLEPLQVSSLDVTSKQLL